MNPERREEPELSIEAEKRIARVRDRFEIALREGDKVDISQHVLGFDGRERTELLRDLLYLEVEHRAMKRVEVSPEEFLGDFPQDRHLVAEVFRQIPTALSLDIVVQRITDSKLIASEVLHSTLRSLPTSQRPRTANELLDLLIRKKLLTRFQERQVRANRARGLIVGNYLILRHIGKGAMGHVLMAKELRLGERLVAMKVAADGLSDEAAKRFEQEVLASAKLSHVNLVRVYNFVEQGRRQYLVMEYVDGLDLAAVLKKEGKLDPLKAVDYIIQAARGLAHAHEKEVIHRDVKPANIMVDESGLVKVLDLGLSKARDVASPESELQLTQSNMVFGTPHYLSPEQAVNSRDVDGKSDIYSLGCTLFHLLTGRVPYPASSFVESVLAHSNLPVPSVCELRPDLSGEVDTIVKRMMAKKPNRRYQDMENVVVALEAVQPRLTERAISSGLSTVTFFDSSLAGLARPLRNYRIHRWFVGVATAGLLVGVVYLLDGTNDKLPMDGVSGQRQDSLRPTEERRAALSKESRRTPNERTDRPRVVEGISGQRQDSLSSIEALRAAVSQESRRIANERTDRPKVDNSMSYAFTQAAPKWRPLSKALAQSIEAIRRQVLKETDGFEISLEDLAFPYDNPRTYNGSQTVRRGTSDAMILARKMVETASGLEQESESAKRLPGYYGTMSRGDAEQLLKQIFQNVDSTYGMPFYDAYRNTFRMLGTQLESASRRSSIQDRGQVTQRQRIIDWLRSTAAKYETPLPKLFRIDGKLHAVRTGIDHTWLFLVSHTVDEEMTGRQPMASAPLMVAVKFPTVEMSLWMADYRIGETVRAVVALENEEETRPFARRDQFVGAWRGNRGSVPGTPYLGNRFPPQASFDSPTPTMLMRGTIMGYGVQKLQRPSSWIDPVLGRAEELANPEEYQNWFGCLFRNVSRFEGVSGTLKARYQGVLVQSGRVILELIVPESVEGTIRVQVDMGKAVRPEEFADYRFDEEIIASVRIREPVFESGLASLGLLSFHDSPAFRTPASPEVRELVERKATWSGILVDCTSIHKTANLDSQINATGSRRQDVEIGGLRPIDASSNPKGTVGTRIQWTGELRELVERQNECHILIRGEELSSGTFEAFTRSPEFIRQLDDYVSYQEDHDSAHTVVLSGTLTDEQLAYRLSPQGALVQIEEIWTKENPSGKAVPGKPGPSHKLDIPTEYYNLSTIWRRPPQIGSEVRVEACFDRFDQQKYELKLKNNMDSSIYAKVNLSRLKDVKKAKQFESGQIVQVVGRLSEVTKQSLILESATLSSSQ